MNTKTIGEISEAKIIARLLEKGFNVAIPFGDNQRYDIVLIDGNKAIRIQCKTGRYYRGGITFNTSSHNPFTNVKKSYLGEIEMFMVYYPETGKIYRIPIEESFKSHMTLRIDPIKNRRNSNTRWASKYEF